MNRRVTRWWIPLAGSLAVYLIPLVGPHGVWLLGEVLLQELTRPANRGAWWLAADVSLVVAAQVVVGLTLVWSLRGSRLRLLAWIPMIPVLIAGLNLAYLVVIPSHFLIEPDTSPEVGNWEEHCLVPDVSLISIRTSVNQPLDGVRAWWMQRPDGRYALLHLPGCIVVDAGVPLPVVQPGGRVNFMLGFQFSDPGGTAVLERLVPDSSERSWWLLASPSTPLRPIAQPELIEGAPILSDAADAVAWIQRVAGSPPPVLERIVVRALDPGSSLERLDIELTPFGAASYTLLAVDTVAREAVVWRNDRPLVIGFDGQQRGTAFAPGAIQSQASTYLRHRSGWVVWDAYRDTGPYNLLWSLDAGSGSRATNNGRSITSAAVDPSGRFIAMSESPTLSIGDARDVVYVIRTSDGSEIFRRYLPRYARSQVVFFEDGLFGYSDLTGTHVLKTPQ